MSDLLLEVSARPVARKWIQSLGLPLPLPQKLRRDSDPWEERPIDGMRVLVGSGPDGQLGTELARTIVSGGGQAHVTGETDVAAFQALGEAWGRMPVRLGDAAFGGSDSDKPITMGALVYDATGVRHPDDLHGLYEFFHASLGSLGRGGRLLILARPPEQAPDVASSAARAALSGFVRSCAKELGSKGVTAQLLLVDTGAEERCAAVARWLLSARSAFVTGQVLRVNSLAQTSARPTWVRPMEKKVALVTGAAQGIGAATAHILAREGAMVVCLDRPEEDEALSQTARRIGGQPLLEDVRQEGAAARIANYFRKKFGGIDVIVHNAGVTRDKTLLRMKPELWDQTMDVNLSAVLRITAALEAGVLRDDGRIVCLSSISGISGNMGQTNYAASKAGIIGYVQSLAPRLASRGITVNAIAPGLIETRMTEAMPPMIRTAARRLSALNQGGQPADVGEAIAFLASPGASGVTGSVLRVCGGAFVGA